jgi:hypothetical protein
MDMSAPDNHNALLLLSTLYFLISRISHYRFYPLLRLNEKVGTMQNRTELECGKVFIR